MNPFLATDGYKTGHHKMYPQGTTLVYSNFTPRSDKHAPDSCKGEIISFGQQMVMMIVHDMFYNNFFNKDKDIVCGEIKKEYSLYLGSDYDVSHIEALHDLGYLPICVKALPEGTKVPIRVPVLTIYNTEPEFYWVTNFLETLISNLLWKPMTSATIGYGYKKLLSKYAVNTDVGNLPFVSFQGHDFSMRGMDSLEATMSSGLGHAISFTGSDSLPVIHAARKYYDSKEGVIHSVNATEHSVMCAGTKEDELETFRYLMKQFPTGILSIVSDTWDLWHVITNILPQLKEEILARDGKIVIRPDSGDPVDILCGTEYMREGSMANSFPLSNQEKGVITLLWDIFGGTVNEQGYKVLDPHIGAIYGDSITIDRAEEICVRLEAKGFASTNVVLGIGSFTYQYNTRDTFGFAMKATYVEITEEILQNPIDKGLEIEEGVWEIEVVGREIFKDPVTDDGIKKSAKGLLMVQKNDINGQYELIDQVSWNEESKGELRTIYKNGILLTFENFQTIKNRLK